MANVKIWLHCVWGVKTSTCLIPDSFRPVLLRHFRDNAIQNMIDLNSINVHSDHVHALINLGKQQNLATTIQYMKGESSFWINSQKIIPYTITWHDDYFAVSISHSQIDRVRDYILNQDLYHKNMTWEQEIELFIRKYGFENGVGRMENGERKL